MKELNKLGLFKDNQKLYLEMLVVIDQHQHIKLAEIGKLEFPKVNPLHKQQLILEVCYSKCRFDKMTFFKDLPQATWVQAFESMNKRIYLANTLIFEKAGPSETFYLIRRGTVMFLNRTTDGDQHPFMEVDSYFGEFELFDKKRSRFWSVVAKTNVVVYAFDIDKFKALFSKIQLREAFIAQTNNRLAYFKKAEREIERAVRRLQRVETKMKQTAEKAIENINLDIELSKAQNGKAWRTVFKDKAIEYQVKKVNEIREKKAIDALNFNLKVPELKAQNNIAQSLTQFGIIDRSRTRSRNGTARVRKIRSKQKLQIISSSQQSLGEHLKSSSPD